MENSTNSNLVKPRSLSVSTREIDKLPENAALKKSKAPQNETKTDRGGLDEQPSVASVDECPKEPIIATHPQKKPA
jgi:hypothetical protein